ncbi:glycosyltransferase family 4 protein [bacterium]|jgi:phosphatidyl-myo-inositol dimannoside synthase|nr:glycosyltransferase family 4 protein [bacterium]
MKKTLVLTHEYFPFPGGVSRYVYNLFKHLPQDKYLVVTDNKQVKTQDNILHLNLISNFFKPSWSFSFFKIKKLIKQHKIEQIFTPNILPFGSLSYLLFKLYKIPYIISLHGLDINLALKNKPRLAKQILFNAKLIITNSQNTANLIKHLNLPESKLKVLYPSFDLQTHISQEKLLDLEKKLGITDDDLVLLTVGRLNKRKGHDLVIEALKANSDLPLKYLVVGFGEEKENLLKLAEERQVTDKIIWAGHVADSDLIYYYKLANIFVTPHRLSNVDVEGFGLVFLEAATCQLPIIAGNSGGVKEILTNQENALLVEADNLEELSSAIRLFATDCETSWKLAQNAYKRSQEFPSAKEQSKKLADCL